MSEEFVGWGVLLSNFWFNIEKRMMNHTLVVKNEEQLFDNGSIDFIIMSETVVKSQLPFVAACSFLFYPFGELLCVLFAFLFQDSWRLQIIAMAVPVYLYVLPHIFLMPESPRWLLSQGKNKQAEKVLRRIANLNKMPAYDVSFENSESMLRSNVVKSQEENEQSGILSINPMKNS